MKTESLELAAQLAVSSTEESPLSGIVHCFYNLGEGPWDPCNSLSFLDFVTSISISSLKSLPSARRQFQLLGNGYTMCPRF